MTSENYRQLLNNECKPKELTKDEFDDTLMHFAMLYHKEQLSIGRNRKMLISFMEYVQKMQAIHFIDKEELADEYLKTN